MDPTSRPNSTWDNELRVVGRLARRMARHWRPALATFVVVLGVSAAVVQFGPKQWRSETVVYYRHGLQWTTEDGLSSRRVGEGFRDILLGRSLLSRVIEEEGLHPRRVKAGRMVEAVEEMRLAVGFRAGQGDVFVISYNGDTPDEARRVAARLAGMLIAEHEKMVVEQAGRAREFLEGEKSRTAAELSTKEAALFAFQAKHPEYSTPTSGAGRGGAQGTQQEAAAILGLRQEEERLRQQLSTPRGGSQPDRTLQAAKDDAEAKFRAAQRDLAEKRANFTEEHPDVRAAEAAAAEASAAYRRSLDALAAVEPSLLEGRLNQVQQEIAALRRYAPAPPPVRPDPSRNSEAARKFAADEAEWARLTREAAEARQQFEQIESRRFVASMTASMASSGQSSQLTVLEPAYLPARPIGMSRSARGLVGIVLSIVAGMGMALVLATRDDRVTEAQDLERLHLAPVLLELEKGSIPETPRAKAKPPPPGEPAGAPPVKLLRAVAGEGEPPHRHGRGADGGGSTALQVVTAETAPPLVHVHRLLTRPEVDPGVVMLSAPDSPASAAFRVLSHRVRERGSPRVILVTSAGPGEGKSLCAVNLALALVESERAKAVVLETNHRSPSLARILGFDPPVDASEQIEAHRQRPGLPWEAVETSVPRLHAVAMSPGSVIRPSFEGTLTLFVAAFRLMGYDYVVIDGPDALGSADVTLMQESIDGLLISARGGVTRSRSIHAAVAQIGHKNLIGFTLFDARRS